MTTAPRLLARLHPPADHRPDAELLARYAADRDEAAFAALVRRHGPMVRAVCRRTAPADADDAFQATFLILSRKAGGLSAPDRLGPWLHGVARRVARRAARGRGRERTGGLPEVPVTDPPADDLRAAVHEEVGRLPEAYRAAVLLCDLEGVTRRAAAERLGIPDGTLSNRLTRARALLGRRLLRRGIGLSGLAAVGPGVVPAELVAASVAATHAAPAAVRALAAGGMLGWGPAGLAGLAVTVGLMLGPKPADPPPAAKPAAVADPTPIAGDPLTVDGLAVTPDGRHLYVTQRNYNLSRREPPPDRITVFDTATWQVVRRLKEPEAPCGPVRFHPDGKTAYVVHSRLSEAVVHRVEVATWKTLTTLAPDFGGVHSFHLSPDGRQLATSHFESQVGKPRQGKGSAINLWDATTFAHQRELTATPSVGWLGPYKPDGSAVVAGYVNQAGEPWSAGVIEFDPQTGAELRRFPVGGDGHAQPIVLDMRYTPGGRGLLVAGGLATPVGNTKSRMLSGRAWRLDGRQMAPYVAGDAGDYYRTMAVSPDGRRLYLGGRGHTLFNPPGQDEQSRSHLACRSKVQTWRTDNTRRIDWSADCELGQVTALLPLPDGERLVVADDAGVWLFDAVTGQRRGGLLTIPFE